MIENLRKINVDNHDSDLDESSNCSIINLKRNDTDKDLSDFDENSNYITIDQAINRLGCGKFQNTLLLIVGLCFCADSIEITLLSFLSFVLKDEWGLSSMEAASITSSVFVGQVLGTIALGYLGDRIGRRPVFILAATIITFFGVLTAGAWNVPSLLLARVLCGFGVGGISVPFDILAELLPSEDRGSYLLFVEYFWTLGSITVPTLAYFSIGVLGSWQLFVVLCAVPCVISLVCAIFYVPESPRWLVARGDYSSALDILRDVAEKNGKDPFCVFPPNTELCCLENEESSDFRDLLKPQWRDMMIYLWVAWFGMGISYYGAIMIVTRVFVTEDDTDDNNGHITFNYRSIGISCSAEIIGLTLVVLAVNRIGRIYPAVSFFGLGGVFSAVLSLSTSSQPVWLLTFVAFCTKCVEMGSSCLLWVITVEILPTELRSTGHGSSNAIGKLGGALCPFLIEGDIPFWIVGMIMFIVHFITAFCVCHLPETKSLEMGQINLSNEKKNDAKDIMINEPSTTSDYGSHTRYSSELL